MSTELILADMSLKKEIFKAHLSKLPMETPTLENGNNEEEELDDFDVSSLPSTSNNNAGNFNACISSALIVKIVTS